MSLGVEKVGTNEKVYIVVEDVDHGPGYGLGEIHRAFKSREQAKKVAKEMDAKYNFSGDPIPSLFVPDLFHVVELELE